MKNNILNIVFLAIVAFPLKGWTQEENKQSNATPIVLETQYNLVKKQQELYRVNPAYLHQDKAKDQTEIYSFYQKQKYKNDYNPLKGKQFKTYGLGANWLNVIDTTASFLGSVAVSKGNQDQIYAQAMRLGDAYGPYGLVHKKIADYTFQYYDLSARYSQVFNQLAFGVHLYYKGDYAYSQTDPRAKDITSWFGINAGTKYNWSDKHEVGLSAGYEIHNQHIALDVWKGNVKQQFFLLRGFGMYDHQHKDHVFSKKRLYKQHTTSISASAGLWKKNPFSVDFLFQTEIRNLKTEEETTINLYELTSYNYLPEVKFNYVLSRKWQAQLQLSAQLTSLKGKENRYSYNRVNDDFSGVYDYVKIGEIKPYVLDENQYRIGVSTTYRHSQFWLYSLGLSYQKDSYDEYYKQTLFKSQLDKQTPKAEAKVLYQKPKYQIGVGVSFEAQKSQKAFTQQDTTFQSLYKEIYLPAFRYRAMDKNYLTVELDYMYSLKERQQIGARFTLGKLWADKSELILNDQAYKIRAHQVYMSLYFQF
ncbi:MULTISPECIES: DUF6850 family outer membrane beta-barrel protein [Myroides]|uniref:DUF6850 family outer membrane beta-barrel protein n=1 Tax=Myroides TaxID=76831 RepID=UPI000280ABF0|nr:DUF6850 family outer membrane beta-barrel protein [Myroides odoratimimus]EKB06023.1 hypothetical protein HMPREF9711_00879 [Myroides odoratimimus CCUG 3837]